MSDFFKALTKARDEFLQATKLFLQLTKDHPDDREFYTACYKTLKPNEFIEKFKGENNNEKPHN